MSTGSTPTEPALVAARKKQSRSGAARSAGTDARQRAPQKLLVAERRRLIRELVDAQGRATVAELATRFGASAVTIRSDLDALARAGTLIRSHGGALLFREGEDIPIAVKHSLHHAEKLRIAAAALELIREGETILLDSGTTTGEIARQLRSRALRSLNVVTNALNVAMELANVPFVQLFVIGGMLRPLSCSLVGPQAEDVLRELRVDRLFLGVDGLDPEVGLTTPEILEARLNAVMIEVAQEVVVVADSSKFGRRSLAAIAGMDKVHKLITDKAARADFVAALRQRGVEVIQV